MSLYEEAEAEGAIIQNSHVVYTPKDGKWHHGSAYVDKDRIASNPALLVKMADQMAWLMINANESVHARIGKVEGERLVVVSPAVGAISWGTALASKLDGLLGVVKFAYADKQDQGFRIRGSFLDIVEGANVVVAEDVLNSGGSALGVAKVVEQAGGKVVVVAAMCDRSSGEAAQKLSPYPVLAVMNVMMDKWPALDCPLCRQGVEINRTVGKWREWEDDKREIERVKNTQHPVAPASSPRFVMPFGKYRDHYLDEIEDSYLLWLVKTHADKGQFDEDIVEACEEELRFRGVRLPYGE
jgi:orotate phosphoribosyltransferase